MKKISESNSFHVSCLLFVFVQNTIKAISYYTDHKRSVYTYSRHLKYNIKSYQIRAKLLKITKVSNLSYKFFNNLLIFIKAFCSLLACLVQSRKARSAIQLKYHGTKCKATCFKACNSVNLVIILASSNRHHFHKNFNFFRVYNKANYFLTSRPNSPLCFIRHDNRVSMLKFKGMFHLIKQELGQQLLLAKLSFVIVLRHLILPTPRDVLSKLVKMKLEWTFL